MRSLSIDLSKGSGLIKKVSTVSVYAGLASRSNLMSTGCQLLWL